MISIFIKLERIYQMTAKPIKNKSPYFPIALDSLRSLLGFGIQGIYDGDLSGDLVAKDTEKSRAIIGAVFEKFDLGNLGTDWDKFTTENSFSLPCIINNKGNTFVNGSFQTDATRFSFFISMQNEDRYFEGNPCKLTTIHSFLIGIEDETGREKNFFPLFSACRIIIDEEGTTAIIEPADEYEFYASLCYMQQCMATCLAGEELNLEQNQFWLTTPCIATAKNEFNNKVGMISVEQVLEYYRIQTGAYTEGGYDNNPAPKMYLH